uniref:Insulin-like domain-containing protein n=1 Tax=Ascaris lumbricoides TaxID=6252 RepID=A0A0M3IA68_ASCLU
MRHFVGTFYVLAFAAVISSSGGDAHRLCGFKLAKIIAQVCDVTECNSNNGLLQIDLDDEQAISNKCCAHPNGCTLDYIQRWCCRNENKYDVVTENEKPIVHRFDAHKKIHFKRPSIHRNHNNVDDEFLGVFI